MIFLFRNFNRIIIVAIRTYVRLKVKKKSPKANHFKDNRELLSDHGTKSIPISFAAIKDFSGI